MTARTKVNLRGIVDGLRLLGIAVISVPFFAILLSGGDFNWDAVWNARGKGLVLVLGPLILVFLITVWFLERLARLVRSARRAEKQDKHQQVSPHEVVTKEGKD